MILYVSERKEHALQVIQALSQRGFFFFYTPFSTAEFLCREKDIGGVIVDGIPTPDTGAALCRLLRSQYPDIPIAAIVESGASSAFPVDCISHMPQAIPNLCAQLFDFLTVNCNWNPKKLTTYYLTVSCTEPHAVYMGYPLKLTPKEHRILYCIFYHAPKPISIDDLIALVFPARSCSIANINKHIRSINRRATLISPNSPPLISHHRSHEPGSARCQYRWYAAVNDALFTDRPSGFAPSLF